MRVPLLNFEGRRGVLLLNFEGRRGVPLLNIEGDPRTRVPGSRVLVALLHHALKNVQPEFTSGSVL